MLPFGGDRSALVSHRITGRLQRIRPSRNTKVSTPSSACVAAESAAHSKKSRSPSKIWVFSAQDAFGRSLSSLGEPRPDTFLATQDSPEGSPCLSPSLGTDNWVADRFGVKSHQAIPA